MKKHKSAEEYFLTVKEFSDVLTALRKVALSANLTETVKWGRPIYTHGGKNIIGIGAFNSYAAVWFFQGALLKDKQNKLINAQEGKTKALRQWRFSSVEEVEEKLLKSYIEEAVSNQEKGSEIKPDTNKPLNLPQELKKVLEEDSRVLHHFEKLSLSDKRDYAEYIEEAKREDTKKRRLDKIIPMILEGKGLNDKYRKSK